MLLDAVFTDITVCLGVLKGVTNNYLIACETFRPPTFEGARFFMISIIGDKMTFQSTRFSVNHLDIHIIYSQELFRNSSGYGLDKFIP